MSSVTKRINEVKQPYGGYIKPSQLEVKVIDDGKTLAKVENIHPSIVGLTVDYLTRVAMGTPVDKAFSISLSGASIAERLGVPNAVETANKLVSGIHGIDSESIINACKLATFDVWRRNSKVAGDSKGEADTNPDSDTVQNIQTMVNRSITFWNQYGPITTDGFTFEFDGYTDTVNSGDGDFLTQDTLWDFKVSKAKPTNKHTLQLLMYWIMGQHSGKPEFYDITNMGLFNPRLNTVYTYPISKVSIETIRAVEDEVICY